MLLTPNQHHHHHNTGSSSVDHSADADTATGSASGDVVTFAQVLRKSLSVEKTIPTYCDDCKKFSPTTQRARCVDLPNILSVNCGLTNDGELAFLKRQMDTLAGVTSAAHTASGPATSAMSSTGMKPCRYGLHCTRVGCHFTHIDRRSPSVSAGTPVSSTPGGSAAIPIVAPSNAPAETWFPLRFAMEIADDAELNVDVLKVDAAAEMKKPVESTQLDSALNDVTELADALPAAKDAAPTSAPAAKKRTYDLSAVVCQIDEGYATPHLVALVYVGDAYHRLKPEPVRSRVGQWYVFNDFNINPIALDEAPWYTLDWKVPCVLFYTSAESRAAEASAAAAEAIAADAAAAAAEPQAPLVNPFVQDYFTQQSAKKRYDLTFKPLTANEVPKAGDFVAMDAEFVTLNPEENEISSDGKTTTIKPCHMSVARITCIRG